MPRVSDKLEWHFALVKVLVVEDEALILALLKEGLEEAGFSVVLAPTSDEAVVALGDHATTLAALVTDVRLPGHFDGWQVARHARALNPGLPVVYVTAQAADEWLSQGVSDSRLLQKPFTVAGVVNAVGESISLRASRSRPELSGRRTSN